MHFTILQLGHTPEAMQAEFERFPPQFQRLLAPAFGTVEFEAVGVIDGAPVPDPASLKAVIVTGSAYGVYDNPPWIEPMRAFIRKAYAAGLPMLGVCFGHQLIADALGGTVVKSEKGWGLGRHIYALDPSPLGAPEAPTEMALAASHQDQVILPPDSARRFLSSDFTPNAGLVYDNDAIITVQPHPEFDSAYSKALCRLRLNNPLPEDKVRSFEQSLDAPLEREAMARLIAGFLKKAS